LLPVQRLQVTLSIRQPKPMVASRITVHGIVEVANGPEPSELQVSLDLNRILDPRLLGSRLPPVWQPHSTGDLQGIIPPFDAPVIVKASTPPSSGSRWYAWVSGFTTIKFIDLESVSYADGTSWHASNEKPCRVPVGSSVW
jgi:hypothetical protein